MQKRWIFPGLPQVRSFGFSRLLVLFALLLVCGCGGPDRKPRNEVKIASPPSGSGVNALAEKYYEEYLKLFPLEATSIGDNRYNDRLDFQISRPHQKMQAKLYDDYLAALGKIDTNKLAPSDRLTYDVFKHHLDDQRERLNWPYELLPVSQIFSLPVILPLLGSGKGNQPFRTVDDYEKFLRRAGEFPAWVDIAIANMREGIDIGIVQAKIVVDKTIPQLRAMIVGNPAESVFFQPIQNFPESFNAETRTRLAQQYKSLIEKQIVPAYRKLHDFLLAEYRPRCRDGHGLWVLPKGRAWYRQAIRHYTTTTLSADEIHEIGKAEVQRIYGEMEQIRLREKFKGTLADFATFLRSKPGVGYTNRVDYIQAYEDLRNGVAAQLTNLFGVIPKAPFEIRAIEEFRENSAPSHYFPATPDGSRPGIFYANAARLKLGPAPISESLFLHEAIPGHHFQASISREQISLPRLRRFGMYTAYVEGWGLYAESLGKMLGCYKDPLQEMDRLASEMWRARRLVVDTGLHEEHWTREQAIQYLQENPVQVMSAELETDRYIAMPGQALGYKLGELRIKYLRDKAKTTMKQNWDLRRFHDELLGDGPLPLGILERKMEGWMEANAPATPAR